MYEEYIIAGAIAVSSFTGLCITYLCIERYYYNSKAKEREGRTVPMKRVNVPEV